MHNYINVSTTNPGLNVNLVNTTMHEKPFVEIYIESVLSKKKHVQNKHMVLHNESNYNISQE